MSTAPNSDNQYQVGGSLPESATTYVNRQADKDFYEGLKARNFCYVLNSRQMGKSSLRVQTMKILKEEGLACVAIEMRDICSHEVTDDEFYGGFVSLLASGFKLQISLEAWWHTHNYIAPSQRLSKFIEEELLEQVTKNIVIFVDEIDSILSLDFKDDFFAFIRSCFNKRASNPKYNRLTLALLGVAAPTDLITDKIRSIFNIGGRFIELTGFELYQTEPLQKGLQGKVSNPKAVMKEILAWTGGQPFLTQRICLLVLRHGFIHAGNEAKDIKKIVREQIVENWQAKDEQQHLTTISERILRRGDKTYHLLKLYQKILQRDAIPANDSSEQLELRLSGLVVKQEGKLRVSNRLYKLVFNQDWVNRELKEREINRASDGRLSLVREVVELLASDLFSFRLTSRFNYIKFLFIIVSSVGITTIAGLVFSEDFRCTVGFRSDSCLQKPESRQDRVEPSDKIPPVSQSPESRYLPPIKPDAALAGNFTDTCKDIQGQQEDHFYLLTAKCRNMDGQWSKSPPLDISNYIANVNGELRWKSRESGRANFHFSCSSIRLNNLYPGSLEAHCRDIKGDSHSTVINLNEKIRNKDSVLEIVSLNS